MTPLFDAWRTRLAAATADHGGKARAAEHLAEHMGTAPASARVTVHRILAGTEPTAEILLCLDGWIALQEQPKKANQLGSKAAKIS